MQGLWLCLGLVQFYSGTVCFGVGGAVFGKWLSMIFIIYSFSEDILEQDALFVLKDIKML